jgi:two-component system LytT family response regulator
MPLRSIIVDDEPAARELLAELLAKHESVELIGSYGDPSEALEHILRDHPDILFLDVHMPRLNGFELLDALGDDVPPAVVFTTAYDEHALAAFDVSAADYLLKPFDEHRLDRAIARAEQRVGVSPLPDAVPGDAALVRALRERDMFARIIPVRVNERIVLQRVDEISWFEADGKYIRIHVGPDTHLIRHTMQRLEQRLDPRRFLRVSRFAIVNIDHVRHIEPWSHGDYVLSMRGGGSVVSTQGYRASLRQLVHGI